MPAAKTSSSYLPSVDISPFLKDPQSEAARQVVDDVRAACTSTGFFQMTGHGITKELQASVLDAGAKFFALPADVKRSLSAKTNPGFRGYEAMASQLCEDDVLPDLKESFFMGTDIPADDERVRNHRFFMGPNAWPPAELLSAKDFKEPMEAYYMAMSRPRDTVLDLVAATLPYGPHIFDKMRANDPVCPLRLLHYPSTTAAARAASGEKQKRQLGSSAHTDFGAITLLLQDEHAGLEVLDSETGEWVGVPPNPDAYVINMGDMISRLTGDLYKSSVHRVINKNVDDRYSVVYFFDGNIDHKLHRLDTVYGGRAKLADNQVLTVEEHMIKRTMESYQMKAKK
ncbi:citrinin biosynthesis oxygenase CtnA [Xylariaceae sp. FL0804]|nr:citrinin biosynthesis oxygenase CtnA [Xylariaceae sp. FL0804]